MYSIGTLLVASFVRGEGCLFLHGEEYLQILDCFTFSALTPALPSIANFVQKCNLSIVPSTVLEHLVVLLQY